MACKFKAPNISKYATIVIGKAVADLQLRMLPQVEALGSNFSDTCPSKEKLTSIVRQKNNLELALKNYNRRLQSIKKSLPPIEQSIGVVEKVITVLRSLPIPNQFTSVGVTNTFSGITENFCEFIDDLDNQVKSIKELLNLVENSTVKYSPENLLALLKSLDGVIQTCSTNPNGDIQRTGRENGTEVLDKESDRERIPYGRYVIEVVTDRDSPTIAPKRFAQALDFRDIVVLKGPSSFSSSTEVLVEELKFRIDNQLA